MEFVSFFWNSLSFNTIHVCGSKFSRWLRCFRRSDEEMPFTLSIIFGPITAGLLFCISIAYKHNLLMQAAILVGWYMLVLLIVYDLDAVQCLLNKKSEFYRATGHSKKDILRDKGLAGEFTAYVLSKKLNIPHKTLYNVCVPMPNGNFQEVDAIIITSQDIFVLECKNRSGNFSGHYTGQMWLQHIGSQEHEVPNIYLQNQEHIAAIEYYLKSKGLMHDFGTCHNMLLSNGHMSLELSGSAANFYYGDIDFLKKNIQEICTKASAQAGEDAAFIDNVYLALLPYALNGTLSKEQMLKEREARKKEFAKGEYRYYKFDGNTVAHEQLHKGELLRKNNIYTQLVTPLKDGKNFYYITVPNMDYEEPAVECSGASEYSGVHYDAVNNVYLDDSEPEMYECPMDEDAERMLQRSIRLGQEFPHIQEGDVRNIKSVPLTKYWENAKQISKPSGDSVVQEYLKIKDALVLTLKRNAAVICAVAAVIVFCVSKFT